MLLKFLSCCQGWIQSRYHYEISQLLIGVGYWINARGSNSESNKKNFVCTLVHFLRKKNCRYTKTYLIKFMLN
jgi:hypothetical protein